jgi:hypothetical protein
MSLVLQSRDVPIGKGGSKKVINSKDSCGGYGTAGEQPERRHEAENWAERSTLCSSFCAQFLAESEKLICPPDSICVMGRSFWNGFAIEMFAIASPGMVSGGCPRGFDVVIEGLGIGNFGLARRLVVDGVS